MPSPPLEFWFPLLLVIVVMVAFNFGYGEGRASVLKELEDANRNNEEGTRPAAVNKADDNNETW